MTEKIIVQYSLDKSLRFEDNVKFLVLNTLFCKK